MARYARPSVPAVRASEWDRLTTSSDRALTPILAGYGQIVTRPASSQAGNALTHRLRVFLIDPQQRIRNIYGLDFLDPELLLADVQDAAPRGKQDSPIAHSSSALERHGSHELPWWRGPILGQATFKMPSAGGGS
jgi:hypothetical protein